MNDRERALDVLRQARDLLAARLTERVLDNPELLLDDARGDSYLGDIESIYEQFGMKLNHLNQLINNLPPEAVPEVTTSSFHTAQPSSSGANPHGSSSELIVPAPTMISGPLIVSPPALPAPRVIEEAEILVPSFQLFIAQVHQGSLNSAGHTLGVLLDLTEARGVQCAQVFHTRWAEDSDFLHKAMSLRTEIQSESYNNALVLLAECFGLVGIEALGVLQTLRNRLLENS
jgi:hypothetical protein